MEDSVDGHHQDSVEMDITKTVVGDRRNNSKTVSGPVELIRHNMWQFQPRH